jgi:hypothetical protein
MNALSFSQSAPDAKVFPLLAGLFFVGKAAIGGGVTAAVAWGTTRALDRAFPARR